MCNSNQYIQEEEEKEEEEETVYDQGREEEGRKDGWKVTSTARLERASRVVRLLNPWAAASTEMFDFKAHTTEYCCYSVLLQGSSLQAASCKPNTKR